MFSVIFPGISTIFLDFTTIFHRSTTVFGCFNYRLPETTFGAPRHCEAARDAVALTQRAGEPM
jgi:hypothetical protein